MGYQRNTTRPTYRKKSHYLTGYHGDPMGCLGPKLRRRHGMIGKGFARGLPWSTLSVLPQIWQQSQLIMWSSSIGKLLKLKNKSHIQWHWWLSHLGGLLMWLIGMKYVTKRWHWAESLLAYDVPMWSAPTVRQLSQLNTWGFGEGQIISYSKEWDS